MSTTEYPVNHPAAVKLWSEKLARESLKKTWLARFMGKSDSSVIQIKNETSKGAGDKITHSLRVQLTGDGVEGDATLEGNEEALVTYTDNFVINQLRHAVRSAGKMSEQRVPWKFRADAMEGLSDWWANRIDTALFNQLCGNTAVTDTKYTGHNATVAPSSNNLIVASQTAEGSLGASNVMTLTLIDYAVEKANTLSPMIRPIKINGEDKYVMFLHDYQVTDLRTSTSTGQWLDIQKAAMQGGQVSNNPIYTGALGEYNGVILHKANRIPVAPTNSNARRALFCGAQAGVVGFGQGFESGEEGQKWYEELFDYGNQLGVSAAKIWGAKKSQFNSQDFGTIVVSTYAVAHS